MSSVTSQILWRYLNLAKKRRNHGSHAWRKASEGLKWFVVDRCAEPQSAAQKATKPTSHLLEEVRFGGEGGEHFPPWVLAFSLSSNTFSVACTITKLLKRRGNLYNEIWVVDILLLQSCGFHVLHLKFNELLYIHYSIELPFLFTHSHTHTRFRFIFTIIEMLHDIA